MMYRQADHSDIETLIALRLTALADSNKRLLSPWETEQFSRQLREYLPRTLDRTFFAWLAVENGQAVASAYLAVREMPASPAFPTGKEGTVVNVYTHPDYRRQGLATALLERLISAAREMNLSRLELNATGTGQVVYEKLGFVTATSAGFTAMRLPLV
jgi:GNAT superfamily N-acetyltransferase